MVHLTNSGDLCWPFLDTSLDFVKYPMVHMLSGFGGNTEPLRSCLGKKTLVHKELA